MTIPTQHNCAHSEEGWCLACVSKLGEENSGLRAELERRDRVAKRAATLAGVAGGVSVLKRETCPPIDAARYLEARGASHEADDIEQFFAYAELEYTEAVKELSAELQSVFPELAAAEIPAAVPGDSDLARVTAERDALATILRRYADEENWYWDDLHEAWEYNGSISEMPWGDAESALEAVRP